MPIYTRRGDKGKTDLHSGERVPKDAERVEAYGTIDELNAILGKAAAHSEDDELVDAVETVQNHLHICQTDLSNTEEEKDHPRIDGSHTDWLEERIDKYQDELPELDEFLLQGGSKTGSELFHARAVCRRAERRTVHLQEHETINQELVTYLNRLSDFLFTAARLANHREGVEEKHPSY